jgi:uncharacterized glyoxalase superfamily protein PhnB
MSEPKFLQVAPAFAAKDFEGLVSFYCDVLGFQPRFKTPVYAVLGRDEVQLHLYPQREGKVAGQGNAYFFVQEVDAIYESCSQKAKVIDPIGDRDYGLRDFLIEDPEGNRVGIAQRK